MFYYFVLAFMLRGIVGKDRSQTQTAQYVVARALTASTGLLSVFQWIQDFVLMKENFKTVAYFNDTECVFN